MTPTVPEAASVSMRMPTPRTRPRPSLAPQGVRPSPWTLLLLLSCFLLPVSLIPSTRGRTLPVPFVGPVWWTDAIAVPVVLWVIGPSIVATLPYGLTRSTRRWFVGPMILLGVGRSRRSLGTGAIRR